MLTAAWAIAISLALQAPNSLAPQAPSSLALDASVLQPRSADDPWPDDKPITRFLPNLWHDLKAIPSWRSAAIAGGGTAVTLALIPTDDDAKQAAENNRDTSYAAVGNVLGNGWVQGGAAVATYVIGRSIDDAEVTHIGSDLIRAQVLNGVLTGVLKITTNRTRPNGGSDSFPSGHASATFASAAVLQSHFGWKVGLPAYVFGGFVAWCRVRDLDHWVTDTAAGATLGIVVGQTVAAGHRARTWQVVPTRTAGGFAVYIVKIN